MTDETATLLLARAFAFAAEAHAGQRRKGAAAEPYVNHLAEVALRLAQATGGRDPVLVAAGLLHDTVEDTPVTAEALAAAFGAEIAALVAEVTDDKALPKAERKRLQVVNAPKKSPRAAMLKLADKASNVTAIRLSPPDWPLERRHAYAAHAEAVAAALPRVHGGLEADLAEAIAALRSSLG